MRTKRTVAALSIALAFLLAGCLGGDDTPSDDGPGDEGQNGHAAATNETDEGPSGIVQESTGAWTLGIAGCLNVVYAEATDGIDSAWVTIQTDARGGAFNATFDAAVPAALYGLTFSADGTFVGSYDSMDPQISGTVPASAEDVILWSCGGAEVSAAFTVTAA